MVESLDPWHNKYAPFKVWKVWNCLKNSFLFVHWNLIATLPNWCLQRVVTYSDCPCSMPMLLSTSSCDNRNSPLLYIHKVEMSLFKTMSVHSDTVPWQLYTDTQSIRPCLLYFDLSFSIFFAVNMNCQDSLRETFCARTWSDTESLALTQYFCPRRAPASRKPATWKLWSLLLHDLYPLTLVQQRWKAKEARFQIQTTELYKATCKKRFKGRWYESVFHTGTGTEDFGCSLWIEMNQILSEAPTSLWRAPSLI